MPAKDHLHTYRRIRGEKSKRRYACTDPDCSHIADKSLLSGKRAICPYCGNDFLIEKEMLELALPYCLNCKSTGNRKLATVSKDLKEEDIKEELDEIKDIFNLS